MRIAVLGTGVVGRILVFGHADFTFHIARA
jgi:hypothetical protein